MTAPEFFTDSDIAEWFDVSVDQAATWRRHYGWPHFKVGRQVRYTAEQVAEIVAMQTRRIPTGPPSLPGQTRASASRRRAS